MSIPKDKNYPSDSVQCGTCGGMGCSTCEDRGWLTPRTHRYGGRCYHCDVPLNPAHVPVYCSDECALDDATD